MESRQIAGVTIGGIGAGAGIAALAADLPSLGLVAGGAAALAALIASTSSTADTDSEPQVEGPLKDALALQIELESVKSNLVEEQRQHDETRRSLADYMIEHPPAGSFDRKLADTETPFVVPRDTASQTDTRLLADPETNLFSEAYFRVALDARIASARRHLRPVAVALVEVVEGSGGPGSADADATKVTGSIRQTLRDADTACRMADGCFALILEDTPENGAVWTVERIRRNLTSRFGQHTMWAGVACYPAHAFSTDELLDQASVALDSAREWKQDRIEVATAES